MKLEMVAYMELTKVAHKVADKKMADMELDMAADMFKTKGRHQLKKNVFFRALPE